MAAYPDDEEAIAHLKEHHGLTVTAGHLASLRYQKPNELQRARDNIATQHERALISDLGDNARLAAAVVKGALIEARRQLEAGKVTEPSRMARDIADVQAKAIDKSRLLQDKPTAIVQRRDLNEIWAMIEAREAEITAEMADAEAEAVEDQQASPDQLPPAARG
jgi:hypothetical protein